MFLRAFKKIRTSFLDRFARQVSINGVKIEIDRQVISPRIVKQMVRGIYERTELDIVGATLENGDRVLELGTGLGLLSIFCAKKIGSERVSSYEANPDLLDPIHRNCRLNSVSPQVHNMVLLAGQKKPFVKFYVCDHFFSSSLQPVAEYKEIVEVAAADLLDEVNKVQPTYWIIDVEGYEYSLFRNLTVPPCIKKICMEVHPEKSDVSDQVDLVLVLKQQGFNVNQSAMHNHILYASR